MVWTPDPAQRLASASVGTTRLAVETALVPAEAMGLHLEVGAARRATAATMVMTMEVRMEAKTTNER